MSAEDRMSDEVIQLLVQLVASAEVYSKALNVPVAQGAEMMLKAMQVMGDMQQGKGGKSLSSLNSVLSPSKLVS